MQYNIFLKHKEHLIMDINAKETSLLRRGIRFTKRIVRFILALISIVFGVLLICLCLLWLEHKTSLTLPKPTGQFAISRTSYIWVDTKQVDSLAPHPGTKRELAVWIWYPSEKGKLSPITDNYMPGQWLTAINKNRGGLNGNFLTRDLSKVHGHSILSSGVSEKQKSYPVVIIRAGLSALTLEYSVLAEDLASQGYIVVGFDAPHRTSLVVFPDGRVISRTPENNPETLPNEKQQQALTKLMTGWCDDTKFVLDQLEYLNTFDSSGRFTGKIDTTRIGIFGHSLGGATAAQFCHDDERCKAGIDIDGALHGSVLTDGLQKPFMFITSDYGNKLDPANGQIRSDIRSLYNRLPEKDRLWITILGARHFNYSDMALLKDRYIFRLFGALGPIDQRKALGITSSYVRDFFNLYLKDSTDTLFKKNPSIYSEVKFEP